MKQKLLSILLYIISLFPFWILYRIADIGYLLLYYVIGYRKKVVYENLRNSFPDKTNNEIKSIAKKFYRYFPDIFIEAIKMTSMSRKRIKKRMEVIDEQEIYRHLEANKGVIGITAHYANWELGIHTLSLMTEYPKLIIYKPLNNKTADDVYNNIRSRFGAIMVPMKQILRHIVRLKGQPYTSVFVADQTPTYQDSDYFLDFLNQDTLVYTGAERIARLTNNPVVFCHIGRKKKRGYYFCKFTTLVEDPSAYGEHEITKLHNKFTENIIKNEPEYWLWSHKRWKRKRRK